MLPEQDGQAANTQLRRQVAEQGAEIAALKVPGLPSLVPSSIAQPLHCSPLQQYLRLPRIKRVSYGQQPAHMAAWPHDLGQRGFVIGL